MNGVNEMLLHGETILTKPNAWKYENHNLIMNFKGQMRFSCLKAPLVTFRPTPGQAKHPTKHLLLHSLAQQYQIQPHLRQKK